MTSLLKLAIEELEKLSPERQDELARMLLDAADSEVYVTSLAERAAIEEGLADARAGRFASEEKVEAIFGRHLGDEASVFPPCRYGNRFARQDPDKAPA